MAKLQLRTAEGGGPLDMSRPGSVVHDTDDRRRRRIERANAIAWVIKGAGAKLDDAQLLALERVLS